MKAYVVGGAVRDELLGLPVQDHDWVVVGATPDEMIERGFRPVGKDFPVFLHPGTQEEYALARTERKTAPGYHGFVFHTSPDVTLEDDLVRRDLTVNAMARAEDGAIVDPYGGQEDLRNRVFRHVSDAFAEDPVRILRVARFAARLPEFRVAAETNALMRKMVEAGEVDALVPERVWQELARGLMEKKPSRMFDVLRDCGALARILPELDALWGVPQPAAHHPYNPQLRNYSLENNELDDEVELLDSTIAMPGATVGERVCWALDYSAQRKFPLTVRFALTLLHIDASSPEADCDKGTKKRNWQKVKEIADRLKTPTDCRDLAVLSFKYCSEAHRALEMDARSVVDLLTNTDAFRRPNRFQEFLLVCEADARAFGKPGTNWYRQASLLNACLAACQRIDTASVSAGVSDKSQIPAQILAARVSAVAAELNV
jgi:tRNA nucleotidyltransferase (CCA-adding enzyme)